MLGCDDVKKDSASNIIVDKSFDFAVKIVHLARGLKFEKEFEFASQVLRSGTSIGANIAEAQKAQSKKDFLAKMYIASKETNETIYWLKLLHATKIIPDNIFEGLNQDIYEVERILISIIKTTEEKLKSEKAKP